MVSLSIRLLFGVVVLAVLVDLASFARPPPVQQVRDKTELEGKLVKGNRNAVYLVENGKRRQFPDFNTFQQMGFNASAVIKIPDDVLHSMPISSTLPAIAVYRPDDYMFHTVCDDSDRMINDLAIVPNMGDFDRILPILDRVYAKKRIDILALGGSITAGGYFLEFVRTLKEQEKIDVTTHNHGHGATEITYTIFCVDIERYSPDLVLIDFSVNDYGHPKLMDALIRKVMSMKSNPIVVLVNLWVSSNCGATRYLLHGFYYNIPIIAVCSAVNLCFGHKRLPKSISDQYSKTDGVHPWGPKGVKFIGDLMSSWWRRLKLLLVEYYDSNNAPDTTQPTFQAVDHSKLPTLESVMARNKKPLVVFNQSTLPFPLYATNPVGICTRCEALVDDADAILKPVGQHKGFRVVTRTKIGFGGFNPKDRSGATKSFKRSWQAEKPGSEISFRFYGTAVKIAIWQKRDAMGVLHAYVDNDKSRVARASGFFKGYTWAMERNNTGRSEIISLFEGLQDKMHLLTLVVSDESANKWVPGHTCQVFALLSASDSAGCKNVILN